MDWLPKFFRNNKKSEIETLHLINHDLREENAQLLDEIQVLKLDIDDLKTQRHLLQERLDREVELHQTIRIGLIIVGALFLYLIFGLFASHLMIILAILTVSVLAYWFYRDEVVSKASNPPKKDDSTEEE